MITKNKNGIICDLCKTILEDEFIYYSFDIHKVKVDVSKSKISDVDKNVLGLDVCEKCYQDLANRSIYEEK